MTEVRKTGIVAATARDRVTVTVVGMSCFAVGVILHERTVEREATVDDAGVVVAPVVATVECVAPTGTLASNVHRSVATLFFVSTEPPDAPSLVGRQTYPSGSDVSEPTTLAVSERARRADARCTRGAQHGKR